MQRTPPTGAGGRLRPRSTGPSRRPSGRLRRTDGEAAGIQLGTSLVDRQARNVGSFRRRPLGWAGSPSAGGVRAWRSLRSSPSPDRWGTWRREAASRPGCGWKGRRFLVSTGTPCTANTANPAHIGIRRASGRNPARYGTAWHPLDIASCPRRGWRIPGAPDNDGTGRYCQTSRCNARNQC